jgi:flavin-dependent dehydrogenase
MGATESLYSAVVVGGGPAGSTAAAMLAGRGRSVLLLERERFPRFHIGESLLPLANEVLEELGLVEELRAAGHVEKRGATFETEDGALRARIAFESASGVAQPRTWQVPRAEFDHLLLRRARAAGAEVIEGAGVMDFETGAFGARVRWSDGEREHVAHGRVLLDASGRAGLVARRYGLRVTDPELKKVALFAHFRGVQRLSGNALGDIHVITRRDGGWIWSIPLAGGITSVGFVFDHDEHIKQVREDPAACLQRWIAATPAAARILAGAERASPARFEGDFSYSTRAHAGEGFALLGDAAAFLDPVFSTGVQLALTSGKEVALDLDRALQGNRPIDARAFRRSTRAHARRLRVYRRLVTGFYRPAFRDLLFRPERWPAGARALAAVLAGLDRLSLATRARLAVFHVLVDLHERLHFVPSAGAAPARVDAPLAART